MKPPDRTGQVWELPEDGTVFLVTGPPWRHEALGWRHPVYILSAGEFNLASGPSSSAQEDPDVQRHHDASFEGRGWKRIC